MSRSRFASYESAGEVHYGAVTDAGMISLTADFPQWPTLQSVIEAGELEQLAAAVANKAVTHTEYTYQIPLSRPGNIICVGVNFPDRNAEYKDGEAEIVFVMKDAIAGKNITRADVIAATDYVAPSIEILDTHIMRVDSETGQTRNVFDTISDNAANAGIVLGNEKHAVDAHDLRWVGAFASTNGSIEETGLGAGMLNDPVESVVWLARRMAEYGQKIEPGQVILSGSFIRPIEAPTT